MKCLVCENEVLYSERGTKKYCTPKCRNKFSDLAQYKHEKICLQCKTAYVGKEKQKYCTHHCSTRAKKNNLSEALKYYKEINHVDHEN